MSQLKFMARKGVQHCAAILFCAMICPIGFASSDNLYQVEIIIFENHVQTSNESEVWPLNPALPEVGNSVTLLEADPLQNVLPYQLLEEDKLLLQNEEKNIVSNPNYTLLLHVSWVQPVNRADSQPVHIYTRDNLENVHTLAPYTQDSTWKLDGTISFHKANYVEMKADLVLNKPLSEQAAVITEQADDSSPLMINIRMHEKRRMRSKELHFLDNPVFGMLVKVTPYVSKAA